MSQSLSRLVIHVIFSTKNRQPLLRPKNVQNEIHAYLAGILKNLSCEAIQIGGTADHVHVLASLSRTISLADLIQRLKGASSKVLKEKGIRQFSWQNGYGAFSLSESNVKSVAAYVENQEEHHRTLTFQEEFRVFLKKHRIPFDERYLWD
jgi:REP element-mobilizing transposase RayT